MKIKTKKWQTKEELVQLLSNLIKFPSVTGTKDEVAITEYIVQEIRSLPYFKEHTEQVKLNPTGDGRNFVTALVKKGQDVRNTVVLLSHIDVVDVQDFGKWKDIAFNTAELTETFFNHRDELPLAVQKDLTESDWLFGRGTMDMKCGTTLHMSMLEKACEGEFDGNILFLAVPDEEVNAVGIRSAVPVLLKMAQEFNLEYKACLNSEPMFSRYPGDENQYIYTGSIGNLLAGFYCYGKETHVGEPLSGLNPTIMTSQITCEMELNTEFCEVIEGEVTPPPTCLYQKDLKKGYSVQIPDRSVVYYNLFFMEKPLNQVVQELQQFTEKIARRVEEGYAKKSSAFAKLAGSKDRNIKVNTLTFDELLNYAVEKYGSEKINEIRSKVKGNQGVTEDHELTVQIVDELGLLCKELSPFIVLFFAPPFVPAISSRNHPGINQVIDQMVTYANEAHGINLGIQHYFPGMSDLSFVGMQMPVASFSPLTASMPLWGKEYSLPLDEISELNLSVLNLGPLGKDAHQWTERLDLNHAFGTLYDMLPKTIEKLLKM